MAPGRFASDRQHVGPEFPDGILHHPDRGGFAIVRPGWVGMLRRQAILHADDRETGVVGDPLQHRILQVGRAQHPASAMEVQIDPARRVRRDDPKRNPVPARAGDLNRAGARR